jgi:hypothetical protein
MQTQNTKGFNAFFILRQLGWDGYLAVFCREKKGVFGVNSSFFLL